MNRKVKPWIVATFLLPGLLMYGYFFFIPAIQSFYYSLTEWNGFKAEKVFIGLLRLFFSYGKIILKATLSYVAPSN